MLSAKTRKTTWSKLEKKTGENNDGAKNFQSTDENNKINIENNESGKKPKALYTPRETRMEKNIPQRSDSFGTDTSQERKTGQNQAQQEHTNLVADESF